MTTIDEYLASIHAPSSSWCELLDRWKSLVADCEDGYGWSHYEYDNDATARDFLERLMCESGLPHDVLRPVRDAVCVVDDRMKALMQDGVARRTKSPYWWKTGVLKKAGSEYVDSLQGSVIKVEPF